MTKIKAKRLDLIPSFSWQTRATMFIGVLGGIWLFVDPLVSLLGGTKPWGEFGIWGYLSLLIFAASSTFAIEYFRKSAIRAQKIYITLTVIVTESGQRHSIQVPQDMRIEKFIELFFEYALKSAPPNTALSHYPMFNWRVQVKRRHGKNSIVEKRLVSLGAQSIYSQHSSPNYWNYIDLPGKLTLAEAGVINDDICKLYGTIKDDMITIENMGITIN